MPQQDTILFSEITLEISEVSEFSTLALIQKSKTRKLGKLGNFFKTCNCFAGGCRKFPRFRSFRFWTLYKYQKLGNCFKTYSCFTRGSWKFPMFSSFWYWTLYKNRKLVKLGNCLKPCKVNWFFCLFEEGGNFRGYRVFDFRPYSDNENLENSDSFSKLLDLSETRKFGVIRVFDFNPYA